MQVVRIFNSKNQSKRWMKEKINYVVDNNATKGLVFGRAVLCKNIFETMHIIQNLHRKDKGRRGVHFVVSYERREKLTAEKAHKIGCEIVRCYPGDYQIIVGTHQDTNNLHNHFFLNTVSPSTGKKYQSSKKDLVNLKNLVNEIFLSFGIEEIEGIEETTIEEFLQYSKYTNLEIQVNSTLDVSTDELLLNFDHDLITTAETLESLFNYQEKELVSPFIYQEKELVCPFIYHENGLVKPFLYQKEELIAPFKYIGQKNKH